MSKPFIWGTQVELFAATSLFQVPLYYCQMNENTRTYAWHKLGPAESLRYLNDATLPTIKVKHFELMYHTQVHYDAIVDKCTNRVSANPPSLSGSTSYMEID